MSLRIAIANATPHNRCETFVAAHIAGLDKVVLVLAGGSLPETDGNGVPLAGTSKFSVALDRFRNVAFGTKHAARLRKRIVRRLKAEQVQVVLAEYGITAAEMLPCCQELGIPLVAYFLGFDAYRAKVIERYGKYRELFAGAHSIIAVSHAIREQLISLGAPADKVVYNSCGADLQRFGTCDPAKAPPHFLAVGRFVDKKAPHLTLLAFARVVRDLPEARLTMVGDGDLWETCHQLVRAHGLQESVDLCGPKSPEEIAVLLQRSRAFVQHSVITTSNDREGTPVAMLEAMGAGVPVISTQHGDITELVKHGERGLLCAERDVEGMAAHMIQLAGDPQLAGRMGVAGAAYVRAEHGLHDRIASLQGILEQAVTKRRS